MMKCPTCGLVARDAKGDADGRLQTPPVGSLVLCECGAINVAESTGDAFLNVIGARTLRRISVEEFERLTAKEREAIDRAVAEHKRIGRHGGRPDDLDECAECGHARRQHLDPRWPCNLLCHCSGFVLAKRVRP